MAAPLALLVALALGVTSNEALAARTRWCDEPVVACRATECEALSGRARHRCRTACRSRSHCAVPGAGVGTIAYVVNQCRNDPDGTLWFGQKLMIRRVNRAPVTVMDFPLSPRGRYPFLRPFELCRTYGERRFGFAAVSFGLFQRILVLPDGSGVVFELTGKYALFVSAPSHSEEGWFFVRSDGTGLRRLGPPG